MISPLERAFCYSILEEGNKIEKDVKEKRPYVTLLTNIVMPAGLLLTGDFIYASYKGEDFEDVTIFTGIFIAPFAFTFATIPAHLYVHTDPGKVGVLIVGKLIPALLTPIIGLVGFACALCGLDSGECHESCPPDEVFITGIALTWSITFGIYIYEIIDTYRAAVRYNKNFVKKDKNPQSSFFIQPIITPKGDIFLTGGIRF
jgi:hypothetical protein